MNNQSDSNPRAAQEAFRNLSAEARKTTQAFFKEEAKHLKETYGDVTVTVNAADLMIIASLLEWAHQSRSHWSGGPDNAPNVLEAINREVAIERATYLGANLKTAAHRAAGTPGF